MAIESSASSSFLPVIKVGAFQWYSGGEDCRPFEPSIRTKTTSRGLCAQPSKSALSLSQDYVVGGPGLSVGAQRSQHIRLATTLVFIRAMPGVQANYARQVTGTRKID